MDFPRARHARTDEGHEASGFVGEGFPSSGALFGGAGAQERSVWRAVRAAWMLYGLYWEGLQGG